jgi:hypothetical protein
LRDWFGFVLFVTNHQGNETINIFMLPYRRLDLTEL